MHRIIVAAICAALTAGLVACSESDGDKSFDGLPAAGTASPAAASSAAPAGTVAYEVIETWTMPGGGPGESIVIPSSYLNDDGAVLVGAQLQRDTSGVRNAVVFIFTERRAAELRRFLLDASPEDQAYYQEHYAGQYTRNVDTGYHKLEMCYDGQGCMKGRTIAY